jgi:alkylation response protein AidB-like acyl-CoA dehydrogenase
MTKPNVLQGAENSPDLAATRAELLSRIDAILPGLERNAVQAETDRDLAPESVDALIESGALRLFVPRRFGGYEAGYRTYVEATIKLAAVCGSSAWLSFITNHSDWHIGQMSQSVQDTVWANGPKAKVGTPLTPNPGWTASYVDGGIKVSGEWPYTSGSTFAKWSLIAFPKIAEDGIPVDNILGLISNDGVEIKDTWHVTGMAATGSNTIVVEDVFIPDEHTMLMSDMLANRFPTPHKSESMYQMDIGAVFHLATLVPCVGLAKAALDLTLARIMTKPKPMTYTFYGSSPNRVGELV